MGAADRPLKPEIEKAVRDSFVKQGFMGTIGAWLVEVAAGRIVIELPFSPRVSQQHGLFHGAVVGAIADTAGGYAALSLMPVGSEVLTVEYKINFVNPAKGSVLRAEAHVVKSGRTVSVVRVDVTAVSDGKSEVCAALQATMMRAPPVK